MQAACSTDQHAQCEACNQHAQCKRPGTELVQAKRDVVDIGHTHAARAEDTQRTLVTDDGSATVQGSRIRGFEGNIRRDYIALACRRDTRVMLCLPTVGYS